jgi:hypothetical protein
MCREYASRFILYNSDSGLLDLVVGYRNYLKVTLFLTARFKAIGSEHAFLY